MQNLRLMCVKVVNMRNETVQDYFWYPLRIVRGQISLFKHYLERNGVSCYTSEKAFSNICFVRSTVEKIDRLRKELGDRFSINYLWDGMTFSPAKVDDKRMGDFITVAESGETGSIYLENVSPLLKECHKVKITCGKFRGIEGKLVRIKKSKRVMIELPGNLAVATEYIRPEQIEFID